jgi:hypothetical protein
MQDAANRVIERFKSNCELQAHVIGATPVAVANRATLQLMEEFLHREEELADQLRAIRTELNGGPKTEAAPPTPPVIHRTMFKDVGRRI